MITQRRTSCADPQQHSRHLASDSTLVAHDADCRARRRSRASQAVHAPNTQQRQRPRQRNSGPGERDLVIERAAGVARVDAGPGSRPGACPSTAPPTSVAAITGGGGVAVPARIRRALTAHRRVAAFGLRALSSASPRVPDRGEAIVPGSSGWRFARSTRSVRTRARSRECNTSRHGGRSPR
jgi:hypothetical protein